LSDFSNNPKKKKKKKKEREKRKETSRSIRDARRGQEIFLEIFSLAVE
jgi:hypothetical protein